MYDEVTASLRPLRAHIFFNFTLKKEGQNRASSWHISPKVLLLSRHSRRACKRKVRSLSHKSFRRTLIRAFPWSLRLARSCTKNNYIHIIYHSLVATAEAKIQWYWKNQNHRQHLYDCVWIAARQRGRCNGMLMLTSSIMIIYSSVKSVTLECN